MIKRFVLLLTIFAPLCIIALLAGKAPSAEAFIGFSESQQDVNRSEVYYFDGKERARPSSGSNYGVGSSEFNVDTTQTEFGRACAFGAYTVGVNGCTTIPQWFVGNYTTLNSSFGNGGSVARNIAIANSLPTTYSPVAPAIFSSYTYKAQAMCGGSKCGHTGLIIKVDGDHVTTLETWSALAGSTNCSVISGFNLSDHPDNTYVNLGEYLR